MSKCEKGLDSKIDSNSECLEENLKDIKDDRKEMHRALEIARHSLDYQAIVRAHLFGYMLHRNY